MGSEMCIRDSPPLLSSHPPFNHYHLGCPFSSPDRPSLALLGHWSCGDDHGRNLLDKFPLLPRTQPTRRLFTTSDHPVGQRPHLQSRIWTRLTQLRRRSRRLSKRWSKWKPSLSLYSPLATCRPRILPPSLHSVVTQNQTILKSMTDGIHHHTAHPPLTSFLFPS